MSRGHSHEVDLLFQKCDTRFQMSQLARQLLLALGVIFPVLSLGKILLRHSRIRVSGARVKRRAQLMQRITTLRLYKIYHVFCTTLLNLNTWVLMSTCRYLQVLVWIGSVVSTYISTGTWLTAPSQLSLVTCADLSSHFQNLHTCGYGSRSPASALVPSLSHCYACHVQVPLFFVGHVYSLSYLKFA